MAMMTGCKSRYPGVVSWSSFLETNCYAQCKELEILRCCLDKFRGLRLLRLKGRS